MRRNHEVDDLRKTSTEGTPASLQRPRYHTDTDEELPGNDREGVGGEVSRTGRGRALSADHLLHADSDELSKPKKEKAERGLIRPTVRPDIDNLVKIILDGLNGVAFMDDKQVIELYATKWYSAEPRTEIMVEEL